MPTVLISGANRGIGLEFARQYAADGWRVLATCRDLDRAAALTSLQGQVTVLPLDVSEKKSLDGLTADIKSIPIDLVIANAGVSGPRGMQPELVDRDSWLETFHVDAVAPLALMGAVKPNLEKGKLKQAVAISSRLGSIGANESGGLYVYRSSKAALNAIWRSLAIDWKPAGITCVVMHPGWVRTDMGGAGADLAVDESVTGMRRVIGSIDLERSGRFLDWTGREIPW
jgi:NAD(P)-dependent dehydrogenase (short-subunit alcohol dehydrogenase family)